MFLTKNTPKIVKGIKNSFALKQNDQWYVFGGNDILEEQGTDEYAYKIDGNFDQIKKLNPNTPIYAPTNAFEEDQYGKTKRITENYETLEDLYDNVEEILKDLMIDEDIDYTVFDQPMQLKKNLLKNTKIRDTLAEKYFSELTWQSFGGYYNDFYNDIIEQPDAYEELFEPKENIQTNLSTDVIKKLQAHKYTVIKNENIRQEFTPAASTELELQLSNDLSANKHEVYYTLSAVNKMNEAFILSACGEPIKFHNLAEIAEFAKTLD